MLSLFKKRYNDAELKLFDFLSQIKIFERLTHDELQLFIPSMYLRSYKQNEVVFFSGDPSQALYIVRKGKVSLSIDVKEQFEELMMVKSGQAFGDNSLLTNAKRIYNAIVISELADIYIIPHINLMEILDAHPEVKAKMMTSMVEMYNTYTTDLFKIYKSSFGFFEIGNVYQDKT
jgi:CRP-like cAMP-binding protein